MCLGNSSDYDATAICNGEKDKEGIAVDLNTAIEVFRNHVDLSATKAGRLFDRDLANKNLRFLDIGCGIGKHLIILRNNGIGQAFGFDIVETLVRIARMDFGLQNLMVANSIRIPLMDNSVDRVLLYNVIEHCSEPGKVLGEIYRVLAIDGILYMDAPNARSMGDRIFRWGGLLLHGKTSHIQKFKRSTIEELIRQNRFEIEEVRIYRGIYVDYPQMQKNIWLKWVLKKLFDKEISSWEMKLSKIR